MNAIYRFALTATLTLPLAAQDQTATETRAQAPILTLKSADIQPVMMLGMSLGLTTEPPQLAAGEHYVLTLGADRKPVLAAGSGAIRYLELSGDPAGLMTAFDEEVAQGKTMAKGLAKVAMAQGMQNLDLDGMIDAVFDMPKQMRGIDLVMHGSPEDMAEQGFDVDLACHARPGTAFDALMTRMKPNAAGAPVLATDDTFMTFRYSLEQKATTDLLDQLNAWMLPMLFPDAETQKQAAATYARMTRMYDGTGAMTFGGEMAMSMLIGFVDGKELGALLTDGAYLDMVRAQQTLSRDIEVEVEANALEHRGTKMLCTRVFNDGPPNPMFPDGVMTSFLGAVGNYLVMGTGEATAKALVDTVVDQKVKRTALPGKAVLTCDMSIAQMAASFSGQRLPPDAPQSMSFALVPQGKALRLLVRIK